MPSYLLCACMHICVAPRVFKFPCIRTSYTHVHMYICTCVLSSDYHTFHYSNHAWLSPNPIPTCTPLHVCSLCCLSGHWIFIHSFCNYRQQPFTECKCMRVGTYVHVCATVQCCYVSWIIWCCIRLYITVQCTIVLLCRTSTGPWILSQFAVLQYPHPLVCLPDTSSSHCSILRLHPSTTHLGHCHHLRHLVRHALHIST